MKINNEQTGVIYCIRNKENNKYYIGQTLYFKHRISTHKQRIKEGWTTHSFYDEVRKNPFVWEAEILLDNVPRCELNKMERLYIDKYDSYNNGYNSTKGGDCSSKAPKFSEERNKKISATMKANNKMKNKRHRVYNDINNKAAGYHYER